MAEYEAARKPPPPPPSAPAPAPAPPPPPSQPEPTISLRDQVFSAISAFAFEEGELRNAFDAHSLEWDEEVANRMVEMAANTITESQKGRGQEEYVLRRGDAARDDQRISALRKYLSTATTSTASASVYYPSRVSATAACRPLYRRPYVYRHVRLELRKLAQLPMLRVR